MVRSCLDHPDGMPAVPSWSEHAHLEVMDRLNITTATLSISSPGVPVWRQPTQPGFLLIEIAARLTVTGVAEHVLAGNLRSAGKLLGH